MQSGAAAALAIGGAATRVQAQVLTPVTIGILPPSDIAAEPFYAQAEGFFRKAGLDAKIEPAANGAAVVTAVVTGHLDIGYSNVMSLAIARDHGIEMVVLAPANLHVHSSPTAGILVVAKSSPIMNARDLNGRTIAVEGINNIAQISARAWIDTNGGDSKAVRFVEITLSAEVDAVESGRVDAAVIDSLHDTTAGEPNDPLRRLCSSTLDAVSMNFAPSVWFTTPTWLSAHPDAAIAFMRAMRQTAVWANTHRPQSAAILAAHTNQAVAEVQRVRRVTYGETITPELIQPPIDVAARYGLIKANFPATDMIAKIAAASRAR